MYLFNSNEIMKKTMFMLTVIHDNPKYSKYKQSSH